MRTLIVFAAVLLLVGLSVPAFAQTLVHCRGLESGGVGGTVQCGPRDYVYHAHSTAVSPTVVEIATGDGNIANYTNICAPAGWTLTIVANTGIQDYAGKTPHGGISPGPSGACPFKMVWTGPALPVGVPFELGFDHMSASHDVGFFWPQNATATNWTLPVGAGAGPVHAPHNPIPTVSTWGLILIVLLLVVAGTLFIVRRRRIVQA